MIAGPARMLEGRAFVAATGKAHAAARSFVAGGVPSDPGPKVKA